MLSQSSFSGLHAVVVPKCSSVFMMVNVRYEGLCLHCWLLPWAYT